MNEEDLNMFNSGYSIEMYRIIEDDFIDFISYVPLEENHLNVYSPKLADIIIRCCNQIETFFKEWLMLPSLDDFDEIEKYRKKYRDELQGKRPYLNIMDYKDFFEPRLELSRYNINVPTLNEDIFPFKEFKEERQAPCWWDVHNHLKHRAYDNRQEATLKVALYAVAALFFLNRSNSVTTYSLQSILEKRGILICLRYPPALESLDRWKHSPDHHVAEGDQE